jgi:hypothetical protein
MPQPPPSTAPQRQPLLDRTARRVVLGGIGGIGVALVGLAVGIPLLFPDAPTRQRLGPPRIVPPMLRARMAHAVPRDRVGNRRGPPPGDLPDEEALVVLTRRAQRDYHEPDEAPAPREVIAVQSFTADDFWWGAERWLAVVKPGDAPEATLIAAQGTTAWAWTDQLFAAGLQLGGGVADQAELARRSPGLGLDRDGLRARLAVGEALLLDGTPADTLGSAFDPATLVALPRTGPRNLAAPPPVQAMIGAHPAMATAGRTGALWFGLLPEGAGPPGPFAAGSVLGGAGPGRAPDAPPLRLWRGRLPPSAQPHGALVPDGAEPVPGLAPMARAGLLMAEPGLLLAPDAPPSVLLAEAIGPDRLRLRRIRSDGATLWATDLDFTAAILAATPDHGRLLLLTARGVHGRDAQSLASISLVDGRLIRRRFLG